MKKSVKKIVNRLKRFIGHEIVRTKPTCTGDWSCTNEAPILISATNKHIFVKSDDGYEFFLDSRYSKKEDWELA